MLHAARRLARRAARTFAPPVRKTAVGFRPLVEWLESRDVPAVLVWDNDGGDYLTSNPLNYSTNVLPTPDDTVVIDGAVPGGVTVDQSLTVAGLNIGAGFNAALTRSATVTVTGDSLIEGGTLDGPAALTVAAGEMKVVKATVAGDIVVEAKGTLTFDGKNIGIGEMNGVLRNSGMVKLTTGSVVQVRGGDVDNKAGATLEMAPNSTLMSDVAGLPVGTQPPRVLNNGTVKVLAGDPAYIWVPIENKATGLIDIIGKLHCGKLTQEAAGAKITLAGESSLLRVREFILRDGSVEGNRGKISIGSDYSWFTWPTWTWEGDGVVTGAKVTVEAGARADIRHEALVGIGSSASLNSSELLNSGVVTIHGTMTMDGSLFINSSAGKVELISSAEDGTEAVIQPTVVAVPRPNEFRNVGTVYTGWSATYEQAGPMFTATMRVPLTNHGEVLAVRGDLVIEVESTSRGLYVTSYQENMTTPASSIRFAPPPGWMPPVGGANFILHKFDNTTFGGPGTVSAADQIALEVIQDAVVRVLGMGEFVSQGEGTRIQGAGTFSADHFIWEGGMFTNGVTVAVPASGLFEIIDGAALADRVIDNGAKLVNLGDVWWRSGDDILMQNLAAWTNDGQDGGGRVTVFATAGNVKKPVDQQAAQAGQIMVSNNGSWSGETGPGLFELEVPFTNAGGNVWLGGFHFEAGYSHSAGKSHIDDSQAKVDGELVVTGGTFYLDTGTLTVNGDVTLGANATLGVTVSGLLGVGRLDATGKVTLGGTLAIDAALNPPVGNRYTVITAGNKIQGNFATITGAQLPNNTHFAPDLGNQKFDLTVEDD